MYTTVDGGVTAGGRRRTAVYSHLPARYHPNRNYRYSRCLPVQAVVQEPVAGGQEQPTGLRELSQSAVCSNTPAAKTFLSNAKNYHFWLTQSGIEKYGGS